MAIDDREQRLMRLVSDASHELVGPANQISSLVSLLVNRYGDQLDEEAANLMAHIDSAGTRMATTAAALRVYFQVIGTSFQATRVVMDGVLKEALLLLSHDLQECPAEIHAEALPDVQGDASLLCQLLQAVLQNSLKFRRRDASPTIYITGERLAGICRFSVSDDGIGIEPRYADTIFVPFHKLNGHSYPGAGLGLATARAIAEMHHGRAWLGEPLKGGATIYFELPAVEGSQVD